MQTIIQLVTVTPYETIVTLPFLYEKPKNAELLIKGATYTVDMIRDDIDADGDIVRRLRVYPSGG